MLISEVLPKNFKIKYDLINKVLKKKEVSNLIDMVYRHCGQKDTVLFADAIKELGFYHAYKAGISFGKDDMIIPEAKKTLVSKTSAEVKIFESSIVMVVNIKKNITRLIRSWISVY